jgi:hypothetical protein
VMPGHFVARLIIPGRHDWQSDVPAGVPALYYVSRPVRLANRYLRRGDPG